MHNKRLPIVGTCGGVEIDQVCQWLRFPAITWAKRHLFFAKDSLLCSPAIGEPNSSPVGQHGSRLFWRRLQDLSRAKEMVKENKHGVWKLWYFIQEVFCGGPPILRHLLLNMNSQESQLCDYTIWKTAVYSPIERLHCWNPAYNWLWKPNDSPILEAVVWSK